MPGSGTRKVMKSTLVSELVFEAIDVSAQIRQN